MRTNEIIMRDGEISMQQPYFLFSANADYVEAVSGSETVSHYYSFVKRDSDATIFAVPDGSIDLLFSCDFEQPIARLCGSPLAAKKIKLHNHTRYFGVRFKPNVIPAFLNLSAKELISEEINLVDILPHSKSAIEKITHAVSFNQQILLFESFFVPNRKREQSPLSRVLSQFFLENRGMITVKSLEKKTGYSPRYINRVFTESFGFSPKKFSMMLRFQYALDILYKLDQSGSIIDIANELGYADQSHFSREFKEFTSLTPTEYLLKIDILKGEI